MKRGRLLFFNTILLTATNLLLRAVSLGFQVYLSKKIGAAGMGLFILVLSVDSMAVTVAVSGIRFATVRLVSEELGAGNSAGVKAAVARCLGYAMAFGMLATGCLYWGADYIGGTLIGNSQTILSLKILAASLVFIAMTSVLSGYFTAVSRVAKSAVVQVFEQTVRIVATVFLLFIMPADDVELACAALVLGSVMGDLSAFLLIAALYFIDKRRYLRRGRTGGKLTERMLHIAVPLAVSSYARTALVTVQNLLIPRGFEKSGSSGSRALADYGMIQGMVFPVITFPAAFFTSLSDLIVPELTEAQVNGKQTEIEALANRILRMCMLFSVGVMGVLFCFSDALGKALYDSGAVGGYIRLLAFLMPVMYLDTVTDGMLRGLGQHMYSMYFNIADSFVCTFLIYFLLPKFAVGGYIFILYFSELFNFSLSIHRLGKVAKLRFETGQILKALFAAFGAVQLVLCAFRFVGLPLLPGFLSLSAHILAFVAVYYVLLRLFGACKTEDLQWVRGLFSAMGGNSGAVSL